MAKYCLLALALFLVAGSNATAQRSKSDQESPRVTEVFAAASDGTPSRWVDRQSGSFEHYGTTSTGVALYWTAFVPAHGSRNPAVLVLHTGGFKTGDAGPANIAQELALSGFLGLAVEYRLAPPHVEMDSPTHPVPGQNDVTPVDDGHYPEQTDDVQLAIRTARADPRCDGRVYCLGGSAGVRTRSTWPRPEGPVMTGPI